MRNKRTLIEKKRAIPGNKKALLENKRVTPRIKGHFWEVGHTDLRVRALGTLLPLLDLSFLDVSSQNNFSRVTFFQWVRYPDP